MVGRERDEDQWWSVFGKRRVWFALLVEETERSRAGVSARKLAPKRPLDQFWNLLIRIYEQPWVGFNVTQNEAALTFELRREGGNRRVAAGDMTLSRKTGIRDRLEGTRNLNFPLGTLHQRLYSSSRSSLYMLLDGCNRTGKEQSRARAGAEEVRPQSAASMT
jgi:hypothetical protein